MVVVDKELWGEYAAGAFMILLRFVARWHVVGLKNFGLEDILMLVALLSYSAITTLIHLITNYGSTIGQTAESVYLLTDEQVASFTIGQKLTFADWLIYLVYIWSLKATLLVIFTRLASGLKREEMVVKAVIVYTAVCLVGATLTHICVCLPVQKSWQVVPYPGDSCALRNLNYYLISFFNASSDLAIIAIPIPIIFKAKIPLWRRLLLLGLLCSGAFVIIATILRAYYSLQDLTLLPVAAGWTSRETFVAAVAVSIPAIKPLFSRSQWFRFRSSSNGGPSSKSGPIEGANSRNYELRTIGGSVQPGGFVPSDKGGQNEWRVGVKEHKGAKLPSDSGSEEIILNGRDYGQSSIQVVNEYAVSSEHNLHGPKMI